MGEAVTQRTLAGGASVASDTQSALRARTPPPSDPSGARGSPARAKRLPTSLTSRGHDAPCTSAIRVGSKKSPPLATRGW